MDDYTDDEPDDDDDYSFFTALSQPYKYRNLYGRQACKSCDKPTTKKSQLPRRKYRQTPYPTHKVNPGHGDLFYVVR